MITVVAALAPVFLLIVIGAWLRRSGLVQDGFWRPAEQLTYHLFFPALLIDSTARASFGGVDILGAGVALAGGVLAIALLTVLARPLLAKDGPAFTSVFQGTVRVNSFIALAVGAALYGTEGTALMALGVLWVVPLVNVLSVLALARWTGAATGGWPATLRLLATNPLILAVLIGGTLNAVGVPEIPVVSPLLKVLAAAALPLGLMAVGAGLDLPAVRRAGRKVLAASVGRLLVLPAITLGLAGLAGVTGRPLVVIVLYNAIPTAASAYVLARQMGGDHRLMAGIITAQTLAATLTLPLWLALLT
ncbi:AEC family transporter [Rhodocista pekingensis]|uniref:AEC family transporter n=1 Tax=Rhodocista pekingensis TaxID=201185 RepID=A0ABW2KUF8_9PROT